MSRHVSAEPFHPGEYISDEMEARGWTQNDLADVLGINRQMLLRLLKGQSAVSPETATKLGAAFEQSPEVWMNLQTAYDLARVAHEGREPRRRAELFNKVPVRELQRRHWIQDTKDVAALERSVCDFLGLGRVSDPVSFAFAARQSSGEIGSSHIAWCARVRRVAELVTATEYRDGAEDCMKELKSLMAYPEDVAKVPALLADFGIRLVIVQHLKGTRIDGVATWVNSQPIVGMSIRFDRVDNFWFTLMHELVHIKYRDEAPVDVDVMNQGANDISEIEERANAEAAAALVDQDRLASFVKRHSPLFYQKKVVQFSQARKVHPAIVVGQLKHKGHLPPTHLNKLQAKVREYIVGNAITDGWGDVPILGDEDGYKHEA